MTGMRATLHLPTAANFRDLGGYSGHAGRRLRRGWLYRSNHLGKLSAEDAQTIRGLGVRRVLDFRGAQEREPWPCVLPDVKVHALTIEPTVLEAIRARLEAGRPPQGQEVVDLMQQTYRGFVRESSRRFAEFFQHVLETDSPLVFHCTAGKDRTGFAAAMLHHALGVSGADMMQDYLLTNQVQVPIPPDAHGLGPDAVRVLYRVQPEFLQASLDAVQEDWGDLDGYLASALGVGPAEQAALRERYLEPG